MENIEMILTGLIEPHPDNPRKDLGDLKELTESIRQNGIYQNLTVVPRRVPMVGDDKMLIPGQIQRWSNPAEKERMQEAFNAGLKVIGYTVIIGHRRLAAAKEANLKKVPCVVVEMAPQKQIETMLLENMQRADLTIMEQVRGFQMLLDFGETAEGIAGKTGFSVRTVKRRAEIARLDPEKLDAVMKGRAKQITLEDFDRLAGIEDVSERNKLLDYIGTNNFNYNLAEAKARQENSKALPEVMEWLAETGAKKIKDKQYVWRDYIRADGFGWSGCPLKNFHEEKEKLVGISWDNLYYAISETGCLLLYRKKEDAAKKEDKKPEKSAAEIEKEKKMNAAWDYLAEQSKLTYGLRKNFIQKLKVSKTNISTILEGALMQMMVRVLDWDEDVSDELDEILGFSEEDLKKSDAELALQAAEKVCDPKFKKLPQIVYALYNDGEDRMCGQTWRGEWPEYDPNGNLIVLYKWLEKLGYETSEVERGLVQGTDVNYHLGDAEKEAEK